MAVVYIKDRTGAVWRVDQSTGRAKHLSPIEYARAGHPRPQEYNGVYRPVSQRGVYTSFARNQGTGALYGITANGEYIHLTGGEYAGLAHPRFTNFNFDPSQRSAFNLIQQLLKSWDVPELSGDVIKILRSGDYDPNLIALELAQTPAYKKRFAGNERRLKLGLPELQPAEYIATEEQYRNILRSYGLPKGFYDQHSDFTNWIGEDVSPAEIEKRVQTYTQQYQNASPTARKIWEEYFGLSQGDVVANLLDPKRYSLQDLENKSLQAGIGAAAAEQGLNIPQARAEQLQQRGVTLEQAQKAYSEIAQTFGVDQAIAQRFGSFLTQTEEENARLLAQGEDLNKIQKLYASEQGLFQGKSTTTAESLSPNLSNYL